MMMMVIQNDRNVYGSLAMIMPLTMSKKLNIWWEQIFSFNFHLINSVQLDFEDWLRNLSNDDDDDDNHDDDDHDDDDHDDDEHDSCAAITRARSK